MTALVMDLGGTRIKAGVVEDGRLQRTVVHEVGGVVLDTIASAGKDALGGAQASDAAMCVPGLVDAHGTLVSLPGKHAGLEGTNIATLLQSTFGAARTAVINDAVAYAVGEATAGAGRGAQRSVVVTIGTGVGVTVIQDGAPVTRGIYGGGILGGFIPIADDTDAIDTSGNRGTIESFCAAERIVEACGGAYATVPEVFEAFARGEQAARDGVERYRARLARALRALASAHAPDIVILGGGPMRAGNPITPGIDATVNEHLFGSYRVRIGLAELGDDAALVGLAHLLGAMR